MLKHADLPNRLWGKAVLHAVYIMNRTPVSHTGGIAPLQYRTKEPLDLSHLRVFGSPAQIHVSSSSVNNQHSLTSNAEPEANDPEIINKSHFLDKGRHVAMHACVRSSRLAF